jgi:uncharacterized protein YigA (DUF484 family)
MKKPRNTRIWQLAIISLLGIVVVASAAQLRRQWVVGRLMHTRERSSGTLFRSRTEVDAWKQRYRQFCNLWLARHQRDITAELLPFLDEPGPVTLRERAARALGRLENPVVEATLAARLQQMQQNAEAVRHKQIPVHTLQLALGRLRSRHQRGAARVEAVARSVGLSIADLSLLSQRVNDPRARDHAAGSPGGEIIKEVVDLLYAMGKRGENIQPFAARLVLTPAQQVKLRAAMLPLDQEITVILDYGAQLSVVRGEDEELAEHHLVGLGPRATEHIIQRLRAFTSQRHQYGERGYVTLFRAANLTGDRRAIPLLKQLEEDPDAELRYFAQQARQALERQSSYPIFP